MSIFTCKPAKDLRANKASIYTHTYIYIEFIGTVVALAVLQCAGDVETPTGGGDDGKAECEISKIFRYRTFGSKDREFEPAQL